MHLILTGSFVVLAIAAAGCSSAEPDAPAAGGTSSGGVSTGGVSTGGVSTGGVSTGGTSTGGTSTGGTSGGVSTGGTSGGVSTGGTSGGVSTGGTSGGGSASGGTSGGAAIGYAKDVQPIFMAKCGECHGGQHVHNNIAVNYADAKKPVESLQFDECWSDVSTATGPKTIGECSLLLGRAGKMPAFLACDAPTPPNPSACLTAAEKDTLAAWVAAGMAP